MSTQKESSQTDAEILEALGVNRETILCELEKVAFADIDADFPVDAATKIEALATIAHLTPACGLPAKKRESGQ